MKNKIWMFIILSLIIPLSVSASPSSEDEIISSFIADTVPGQAQLVENKIIINATDENDEPLRGLQVKAYTYLVNQQVYTVLDIYTTEKLLTTKDDIWSVTMNDSLRPLEAISSHLFTKKRANDLWKFSKELNTLSNLNGFDFYGSEIANDKPFVRILACFLSDQNIDKSNDFSPSYVVTCHLANKIFIPISVIAGIAIVLIIFLWHIRRKRTHR